MYALDVAALGVTVIVTVTKYALIGESFPCLPESELLVNSNQEVVVVVAVGTAVVEIVFEYLSFQVIIVETVAEVFRC